MKPVVLDYTLTREEWVAGLVAVLGKYGERDPYRSRMMLARLGGFIALIYLWQLAGWNEASLYAAAILLPAGEILIQRTLGRRSIGTTFDPGEAAVHLEIAADGLRETTPNRERRYAWTAVRNVFQNDTELAFDLAGSDLMVVPARTLDAAARRQLIEYFEANDIPLVRRSRMEGRAAIGLVDEVTIAKLAVAVAVVAVIVGYATSGPGLAAIGQEHQLRNLLLCFAAAQVAGTGAWLATGSLLAAAAGRSRALARGLAWALFALSAAAFLYGFLWR